MMTLVWAFLGGVVIGLAAVLLMAGNGRVAGISGIVAGLADKTAARRAENIAFIGGLLLALPLLRLAGAVPALVITPQIPLLIGGGLLVGFGTRLGSGCTSGHGVCGLARLSPRSAAAVAVFLAAATATVFLMKRIAS